MKVRYFERHIRHRQFFFFLSGEIFWIKTITNCQFLVTTLFYLVWMFTPKSFVYDKSIYLWYVKMIPFNNMKSFQKHQICTTFCMKYFDEWMNFNVLKIRSSVMENYSRRKKVYFPFHLNLWITHFSYDNGNKLIYKFHIQKISKLFCTPFEKSFIQQS